MPRSIDLPGVMLTVIVAGVIAFVGLVVMDEVVSATDGIEEFTDAETSLIDAIDSFFGMIGVVFIVIVLSVILAYLYAMRGRNGR